MEHYVVFPSSLADYVDSMFRGGSRRRTIARPLPDTRNPWIHHCVWRIQGADDHTPHIRHKESLDPPLCMADPGADDRTPPTRHKESLDPPLCMADPGADDRTPPTRHKESLDPPLCMADPGADNRTPPTRHKESLDPPLCMADPGGGRSHASYQAQGIPGSTTVHQT